MLIARDQIPHHRAITDAVHDAGSKMLLQIIHAGRNARHPDFRRTAWWS
jgi:2,4-dienoyl-CoA reductase (NADPH2)